MSRIGVVGVCFLFLVGMAVVTDLIPKHQSPSFGSTAVIGSPAPAAADAGPPLTREEAVRFGREIELAFNTGNVDELATRVGVEGMVERSVGDMGLSPEAHQSLVQGFRSGGGGRAVLSVCVDRLLPNGCRVLGVREADSRWSVVARFLGEDDRFNYLELKLFRLPSGEVGVEDLFIAKAGEWFTARIRTQMLGGYQKLQTSRRTATAEVEQLGRFRDAMKRRNLEAAYQEFRTLPDDWKQVRGVRVDAMWVLSELPKRRLDYATELKAYRESLPDGGHDTAAAMLSLNFYHSKEHLPEFRKAIRFLDRWTGGDPYLSVLEGRYLRRLGDTAAGVKLIERALNTEPSIEEAHMLLISDALAAKNHPLTLKRFQAMIEQCHIEDGFHDLSKIEGCSEFVRTPEYKQYLAWRAKRKAK